MLPGRFGWAGTLGRLALEGTRIAGGTDNKPQTPSATSPAPTKTTTTAVKPQSPVIPSSAKSEPTTAINDKPFEQQMSDLKAQANSIDFTQAPQYGELNITPEDNRQVSSQSTQVNIKPLPAQTERILLKLMLVQHPLPHQM
jgi:hypothetical protein